MGQEQKTLDIGQDVEGLETSSLWSAEPDSRVSAEGNLDNSSSTFQAEVRPVLDLQDAADLLGGEVSGDQVNFPGPGHSSKDRSATLWITDKGFTVYSRSLKTSWQEVKDHVKSVLGEGAAFARLEKSQEDVQKKIDYALWVWSFSQDPRRKPIERYLASRGLSLPEDTTNLSWVPCCPFGKGQKVPAMVCLVKHVQDDRPLGVHRTALSREGTKAFYDVFGNQECRAVLGPVKGGAVKFGAPGEILGIGEGIESTLSLNQLPDFESLPVWSLLNAVNLASFPVLDGVKTLVIAVDNDPAGRMAASETAARWRKANRRVLLASSPTEGEDLNDLVMRGGHHG